MVVGWYHRSHCECRCVYYLLDQLAEAAALAASASASASGVPGGSDDIQQPDSAPPPAGEQPPSSGSTAGPATTQQCRSQQQSGEKVRISAFINNGKSTMQSCSLRCTTACMTCSTAIPGCVHFH
eukprot:1559017-Pleurochrysis_carterae.AAC.2